MVFFLLVLLDNVSAQDNTKPTTFILIRHAEKGDDGTKDPPLSEEGNKRAARLTETLKSTGVTAIYSTNFKRTKSTVAPLAQAKNLEVKIYEPVKEEELKKIIESNKGGTVVIVGHSNTTPWSANFLAGTKLENFTDAEYSNILIITFYEFSKASLTRLNY